MTLSEQLAKLKASKKAAFEAQQKHVKAAADEGRTLSTEEQTEVDNAQTEIDSIDADIARIEKMIETEAKSAQPVDKTKAQPGHVFREAKNTPDITKGIGFARAARCLALGAVDNVDAVQVAKSLYNDERIVHAVEGMRRKASVTAVDASSLTTGQVAADFAEYLMPQTIVGKLNMRTAPFRQPLITQTGIGSAAWVGEGKAVPVSAPSFSKKTLEPLKVAALAVASWETLRDSSPAADVLIRDSIAEAMQKRLDLDFIDPANAGTAGSKPASITHGLTLTASSGTAAANVRTDLKALIGGFADDNRSLAGAVFITDAATALSLALMTNDQGVKFFPGVGLNGGTLMGLPLIVSTYVPQDADGDSQLFLVDAANIYYNAGAVVTAISKEATIEMSDAPDGTGTMVSLFQNEMVGFLSTIPVNWTPRRTDSVAGLDGIAYA